MIFNKKNLFFRRHLHQHSDFHLYYYLEHFYFRLYCLFHLSTKHKENKKIVSHGKFILSDQCWIFIHISKCIKKSTKMSNELLWHAIKFIYFRKKKTFTLKTVVRHKLSYLRCSMVWISATRISTLSFAHFYFLDFFILIVFCAFVSRVQLKSVLNRKSVNFHDLYLLNAKRKHFGQTASNRSFLNNCKNRTKRFYKWENWLCDSLFFSFIALTRAQVQCHL